MLRRVVLHGHFKDHDDKPIWVTGDTVAEILEIISPQLPCFKPDPEHGRQRVAVGGVTTYDDIYRDLGDQIEIHIAPQFNGGKDTGAFTQILIGAVLIGVSFVPGIAGTPAQKMLIQMGAMAILGGLSQLLAPQPEADQNSELTSRYLGSPKNTTAIGTRIPILYGKHKVFGHVLTFDINAYNYRADGGSSSNI